MHISDKEGRACLRALIAVARVDKAITKEERSALESALRSFPGADELQPLLDEEVDLDDILADIRTAEARERFWQSAFTMVYVDGMPSDEERALLDRIQARFEIDPDKVSLAQRIVSETKDTLLPSNIEPIGDPAARQAEIDKDTLKYSILSAVLGAFPVPGLAIATDLAVVALQVKLVRDIGQYWGHKVDREAAKTLLAGLGVGTGARIALSNLAKLVPAWGSAFGAATAFATTWALGNIAGKYFASGQQADVGALRRDLEELQQEGKQVYARNQEVIEARRQAAGDRLAALNAQRKSGAIDQAEYERQVAALAD